MRHRKESCVDRRGLVLLIVLGMIAMFSLLAVTYVVMSGDSRDASRAVLRGERQRNFDLDAIGRSVLTNMVAGTNDQQSPFYQHDILGDVYGRQSFVTKAHVFGTTPSWQLMANPAIVAATTRLPDFCMVKLTINPVAENGFTLSAFENDYNSRILTVLEGPLTGQSFRIIKYVGHVNPATVPSSTTPPLPGVDPNVDLPSPPIPWTAPDYRDPQGAETAYSVVIDLTEIKGERFTGSYFPQSSTEETSITLSAVEWIQQFGVQSLFYKPRPVATAPYEGFRLLINGAPFNSVGIGIEEIGQLPLPSPFVRGFGNIDSKRLMRIPSPTSRKISPALLPSYDYLNDPVFMNANPLMGGDVGVDGIGTTRNNIREFKLRGQSNEGYDVPDYRDHWLGHITYVHESSSPDVWTKWVKPSYHQPAVIQYVANLFGNPSSLTDDDVREMLRVIDASTSRVLSYVDRNPSFMSRAIGYPRIPSNFTWSNPPTPIQIQTLQSYVRSQITGQWGLPTGTENQWDIDNDGDGIGDAVWMDPRSPVVYGPEGQRLKPLVAITTIDLDGRVNLNAAGERVEALGPLFPQSTGGFKQPGGLLPAGFGYGPKEISLARLLSNSASGPTNPGDVTPVLRSESTRYSFFDELYGARRSPRYGRFPIDLAFTDRSPGRRDADDHFPWHRHREEFATNATLPGMPIGRRGSLGLSFDLNGNPAWVQRAGTDVLPTSPAAFVSANETLDDGYEFSPLGKPISDDPLNLTELEALLRRYDADAASLPPRIREVFASAGFTDINNHIYEAVTTRSGELRYPNLGAALATQVGADRVALHETPSLMRYLQWLHNQRFRYRESNDPLINDPEISYAALTELFSTDFSAGLRMDLNRPFGDGIDNDFPMGQIDDPLELQTMPQVEDAAGTPGAYTREIYLSATKPTKPSTPPTPFPSSTRARLGSRQVLARHLYCLAQLIVPKQHIFPGMEGLDETTQFLRRSEIRARAIAQWAINVVDFRDADATMSRFEYDIFPFGLGGEMATRSGLARRPAYWAPDHVGDSVNGIPNKRYIGVVWGMEMPELVLSETLALHDKRVRDTDIDINGQLVNPNGTDPDFDQYRFPQASLFIELKAVRTAANNSMFVPGVSRLHRLVNGEMHLDLGAMAPATARWGQQPVWRIAISEDYGVADVDAGNRPLVQNPTAAQLPNLQRTTNQFAFELLAGTPASLGNGDITSAGTIEEYIGSGLVYDIVNPTAAGPTSNVPNRIRGFERFVWFSSMDPTGDIPDIDPTIRAAGNEWQIASVYRARGNSLADNSHLLRGGEYLVVAPRLETPIGSLTHHPFAGNPFPQSLRRSDLAANPNNRPVNAPSRQRISLVPDVTRPFQFPAVTGDRTVRQFSFNGEQVNQVWWQHSRRPKALVCAVPILDDPATQNYFDNQNGTDWDLPFPNGIGLNISYPTPVHSSTYSPSDYWHPSHRPSVRLNTGDRLQGTGANRTDETLGFADDDYLVSDPNGAFFPPDSWVDTANPTTNFPDRPFDRDNPFVGGSGRYRSGTYENVRTAYLQRLADPDFPYDPYANPYITVDWMPIDLTVFNGEANPTTAPDEGSVNSGQWSFQSRYRDGRLTPGVAASPALGRASGISVYAPNTPVLRTSLPQTAPPSAPVSAEYPFGLNYESYFTHSLGYDGAISWGGVPQASGTTLGYTNVGFHTAAALLNVADALDGDVDGFGIPFNSPEPAFQGSTRFLQGLYWANRPFASPYEIMMVPATGPGNFGLYHSGFTGNERKGFAFLPSFQANNAWNFDYPSDDHTRSYWAIPDINTTNFESDWGLILDFIETKPPFIDAEKKLNPATVYQSLGGGASPPAWAGVANRFLNSFIPQGYYNNVANGPSPSRVRGPTLLAPFNSLPSFVSAGKVNINTLTFGPDGRSKALESIEQHYLRGTNVSAAFANSRHGYDSTNGGLNNAFFGTKVLHFNPNLPTDFAGAFRPAMTSNLAPELHNPAATAEMRGRWNAQTGLLRAFDLGANANGTQSTQQLAFNSLPAAHGADAVNGQPFAKYQRMMRLPNLVTNQSNVFASWVTISLFEYDPITGFGNEYLSPTGEPIRERYFYIIDRTVPVGYSPGERLNMKRTILLEKKL